MKTLISLIHPYFQRKKYLRLAIPSIIKLKHLTTNQKQCVAKQGIITTKTGSNFLLAILPFVSINSIETVKAEVLIPVNNSEKKRIDNQDTKQTEIVSLTPPLDIIIPEILFPENSSQQLLAQVIRADDNDTETLVNPGNNRFDIQGGKLSQDGQNLFHSFEQFNLNANQVANFLTNPNVINILGRVVGESPSVINGLIQVIGGNSNLYLINPNGIVFGSNAQLNVPAGFTATTATGISFGDNWFNVIGSNNYQNLVGNPRAFAFDNEQSGSIINGGDLSVGVGESLTLLGGSVVSTGKITAPGGVVTIAAVPGESVVRISQPGSLLGLEIEPPRNSQGQFESINPLDLPNLLTGVREETGLTMNEDGTVHLTDGEIGISTTPGTVIVSGDVDVVDTDTTTPGEINIVGSPMGVIGASLNTSGSDYEPEVLFSENDDWEQMRIIGVQNLNSGNLEIADSLSVIADSLNINEFTPSQFLVFTEAKNNTNIVDLKLSSIRARAINEVTQEIEVKEEVQEIEVNEEVQESISQIPPNLVNIFNHASINLELIINKLDNKLTTEIADFLGVERPALKRPTEIRSTLGNIEQLTGLKPALVYISFTPSVRDKSGNFRLKQVAPNSLTIGTNQEQSTDNLELIIVTASGEQKITLEVTRAEIEATKNKFRGGVTNIRRPKAYLQPAQQLYTWLIKPLEPYLLEHDINNLVFLPERTYRALPFAALHDGQQFLIEKYSVSIMPSLSITNTDYVDLRGANVLAMGASQFANQDPLPAVPIELETITSKLWQGDAFLNETFTIDTLKQQRSQQAFEIVHFATHGEFSGAPNNSFIQFWQDKVQLNEMNQLELGDGRTHLLVLSACRTAFGDEQAELGFAGLAVQAGVASALGSLWSVSDQGTLGLMTGFYAKLETEKTKVGALRKAQLEMLLGKIKVEDNQLITSDLTIPLPPELFQESTVDLSHPYYWSSFTLVGNPW